MKISKNQILAVVLGLASALAAPGFAMADDSGSTATPAASTSSAPKKHRHHFHNKAAFQACVAQSGISVGSNGKVAWTDVSQGDKAEFHSCMQAARQKFKQAMDTCLEGKGVSLPLSRPLSADTKTDVKACVASVKASQSS
jgi:predicted outer membrane protein